MNESPNARGSAGSSSAELIIPAVTLVAAFVGTGASLLQYATEGPEGVWWLLFFFGAGVLAIGLGVAKGVRLGTGMSLLAATLGAVIATVGLLGGLGMLQGPNGGPDDEAGGGGSTPTPTSEPSPSDIGTTAPPGPGTPTGPGTTTGQPPTGNGEVGLTVAEVSGNEVTMLAEVTTAPAAGNAYFLLLELTRQNGSTEVYAQKRLAGAAGSSERVTFELYDLSEKRTARIVSASPAVAQRLQAQLDSPREDTDPMPDIPCTGCTVSPVVPVTPR